VSLKQHPPRIAIKSKLQEGRGRRKREKGEGEEEGKREKEKRKEKRLGGRKEGASFSITLQLLEFLKTQYKLLSSYSYRKGR
jgi:hypothetical protein